MDKNQRASDPQRNITVTASAGTGKTYLLITRLLRLLLCDTSPETILAITFTRKAAAEMQHRITERLHELLTLTPAALHAALEAIGITPDIAMQHKAQTLYERLLRCEQPLRITTFHAFCQEILRRFPLEADVPPGFEILDSSGLIEKRALDALFSEATQASNGELSQALETLMSHCGGISNTDTALKQFIQHRSDWWAYTHDHQNPLTYACQTLAAQLNITPHNATPDAAFLTAARLQQCQHFAELLSKHNTKTNAGHTALFSQILDDAAPLEQRIAHLRTVFLTNSGEPRKRKESAAQRKVMGAEGEALFVELHHAICDALLELQDQKNRYALYYGSAAWYRVGEQLLHHYQTIKQEQRLLDFADLEWRAYLLLNHHNNAHWVQYKLDQRINHLLVDEFQDTNPTQWRLLLPLLQELASGETQRSRSVFLVGDSKQSIYRFRRADPKLFDTAQQWLGQHLNAETRPLDISWRSAPAIIDFVNRIFEATPLGERLTTFQRHDTHQQQLWGKVEMLPLLATDEGDDEAPPTPTFRNPLHQPRTESGDSWQQHYDEGNLIAMRIQQMLSDGTAIKANGTLRTLQLNDVIILLRSRTHLSAYEAALRQQNIAYISNTKSTILDTLEAQDLVALLNTLITPHNNLALAQVLRSPLFNCSDQSLMVLAAEANQHAQHALSWFTALTELQDRLDDDDPLARAFRLITQWQQYAGTLPVHDLLDRIYHEGDLQRHYHAAFPPHLRVRVESNLIRFIELALEIDSGRYPSLPHFINRLKRLKEHAPDSIDEPASVSDGGAVRIMTIHAAKGLEAPVVFIADAARVTNNKRAHQAIVNWPSEQPTPSHFFLCGSKNTIDRDTAALIEADDREEEREDANLLYVALTRARQHLIISGCIPKRGKALGWYGAMAQQLMTDDAINENAGFEMSNGKMLKLDAPAITPAQQDELPEMPTSLAIEPSIELPAPTESDVVTPSKMALDHYQHNKVAKKTTPDEDETGTRGAIIHRILELITDSGELSRSVVAQHIAEEYELTVEAEALNEWLDEAYALIATPALQPFFDPTQYQVAHNEIPIHFYEGKQNVAGIVDRLVITDDTVTIIDYKTHRHVDQKNVAASAQQYQGQMSLYRNGVEQIWPDRQVKQLLIFTRHAVCHEL